MREVLDRDHGCSAVSISSFAKGALGEQFWQYTKERQRSALCSDAGSLLLSYQPIIVLRVLLIGFGSD